MAELKDMLRAGTTFRLIQKIHPDSTVPVGTTGQVITFFLGRVKFQVTYKDGARSMTSFHELELKNFGRCCEIIAEGPPTPAQEADKVRVMLLSDMEADGFDQFVPVVKDESTPMPTPTTTAPTSYQPYKPPTYTKPVPDDRPWEELTEAEQHAYLAKLDFFFVVGNEEVFYSAKDQFIYESGKRAALQHMDWEMRKLKDGTPVVLVQIPPEHAAWKKTSKSVATCAFVGTDEYMKHVLGMSLHSTDRTWYVEHPLTETGGLPAAHTLTLLNDLVKPWGLGISRIYVRKAHIDWPEHLEWKDVLGCNGMAYGDCETTDEEYVAATIESATTDEEREQLRQFATKQLAEVKFSYCDKLPNEPMVIFEGGYGTKFATGGGHASFVPPRSFQKSTTWGLAVQFDRIANCVRHTEVPTLDHLDGDALANLVLDVKNCKVRGGEKKLEQCIVYTPHNQSSAWNGTFKQGGEDIGTQKGSSGFRTSGGGRKQKSGGKKGRGQRHGKAVDHTPDSHNSDLGDKKGLEAFGLWVRDIAGYNLSSLQAEELIPEPEQISSLLSDVAVLSEELDVQNVISLCQMCDEVDSWQEALENETLKPMMEPIGTQFKIWAKDYIALHSLTTLYFLWMNLVATYKDQSFASWIIDLLLGKIYEE